MDFRPENHFLAKCKNSRFSVIPAGTGSVVNVGHFLVTRMPQTSFVDCRSSEVPFMINFGAIWGVPKMALPMPETKNGDKCYRPNYPPKPRKITFETRYGHSKVVFWPYYIFCIFWPRF